MTPTKARIPAVRPRREFKSSTTRCAMCDRVRELRPYGPKGEHVCFTCGMKDVTACEKGANRLMKEAENIDGVLTWRNFVGFGVEKWEKGKRGKV